MERGEKRLITCSPSPNNCFKKPREKYSHQDKRRQQRQQQQEQKISENEKKRQIT